MNAMDPNIHPALRQNSLTSPPKPHDVQHYQNGAQSSYPPMHGSPTSAYQSLQRTPGYYGNSHPQGSPDESPPANPADPNDLKRPRACEACRQLKVKCEPDESNTTGACKRCAKANRQCIVTAPSRKRQKKTDSRVAELEKKIDALTASLAARGGEDDIAVDPSIQQSPLAQQPHIGSRYAEQWHQTQQHISNHSPSNPSHGMKRKATGEHDYFGPESQKAAMAEYGKSRPTPPRYQPAAGDNVKIKSEADDLAALDLIERGIMDYNTVRRCFERYMNEMSPGLPLMVFPPNVDIDEVRKNKPILFFAVIVVACGTIRPDLQPRLNSEITKILADRIVYRGEKSMELVQTIQVMTLFYQPPERYDELNFNQLIHIAAVMAFDIGLGKRIKKVGNLGVWRPVDSKRSFPDPHSPESRRCWLGCYFMCSNSAMSLRRPLLIRWGPYAEECVEYLTKEPDALPSDKWLCFMVRGQQIAENVGLEFSMDDPVTSISLADPGVQFHLKAFEKQLSDWHNSASPEMVKNPILSHSEAIVNLYLHEIAMHHNHNIDDFRPPYIATSIECPPTEVVTPAHIKALTACLQSCHQTFEAFLSMDVKQLRSIPTLFFVRNSYAAVALIKMYTAVSAKGSKFGEIFKIEDLKVETYLDRLLTTLTKTAEGGMSKVAFKFSLIFNMLKNWHMKRTEPVSGPGSNPSSRQRTPAAKGNGHSMYKAPPLQDPSNLAWNTQGRPSLDNTPTQRSRNGLQMLSDAAMGPGPPQAPNQQPWMTQHHMSQPQMVPNMNDIGVVNDPNMMTYGMVGQDLAGMDFSEDLMALGFSDEFMAMNFGFEQAGWNF